MKKSMKKGICLTGIVALSLFSGAITFTQEIGKPMQVAKPVTYNQQSARARQKTGSKEAHGNLSVQMEVTCPMDREVLSEAGAYYFVDSNGDMLTNSKTPDGYQVDGAGIWRAGAVKVQRNWFIYS